MKEPEENESQAIELFMEGRFLEAAKRFSTPEWRCAALLNSGDRAALISEPASYDQLLFLSVARGWSTGRLIRKIDTEGLCEPPHSLAPWIARTSPQTGRLLAKRIAENMIVPTPFCIDDASSFVRDQMQIDERLLAGNYEPVAELIRVARERWGQHPHLMLSEARLLSRQNRPLALEFGLRLATEYPQFAQGLTFTVDLALNQLFHKISIPADPLAAVIEICERGAHIDAEEDLFKVGPVLRSLKRGSSASLFVELMSLLLSIPANLSRQRALLNQIRSLRRPNPMTKARSSSPQA